jgi:hypothetical protein
MADKSAPAPVATPEEVAAFAAAQEEEWGTYVAIHPISYNGVPAYNVGDPVAVSNVRRYKYDEQGLVEKVANKAAQEAIRGVHQSATASEYVAVTPVALNVPVK